LGSRNQRTDFGSNRIRPAARKLGRSQNLHTCRKSYQVSSATADEACDVIGQS
jgi:hypothetical protein